MKDRCGYEYAELIGIQCDHLARWKEVLKPALFAEVRDYVLATNQETFDAEGRHRVYRGHDLTQIIFTWPDIGPCFAPKTDPVAEALI